MSANPSLQAQVTARIGQFRAVMEKATPGKWEVSGNNHLVCVGDRVVCQMYTNDNKGDYVDFVDHEANAIAIALAHNIMKSNLDAIEWMADMLAVALERIVTQMTEKA